MRPDRYPGLSTAIAAQIEPIASSRFAEQVMALPWWPSDRRAAGLALIALGAELDAIRIKVTEPTLGQVRVAFWRDVLDEVEGERARAHPVAEALLAVWPHLSEEQKMLARHLVDGADETLPDIEGGTAPRPDAVRADLVPLLKSVAGEEGALAVRAAASLEAKRANGRARSALAGKASLFLSILRGK